eukprot:13923041-Alexandrium_andersonii.AAC.1
MAKSHSSEPWLGGGSEAGCEGTVSETVWRRLLLALSGQSAGLFFAPRAVPKPACHAPKSARPLPPGPPAATARRRA